MAPPMQHPVSLSETERAALERVTRTSTAEQRQVQRAQVVLWSAEGVHGAEIARRLRCTPDTVTKWQRRWSERSTEPPVERLNDAPRSGRPVAFSP